MWSLIQMTSTFSWSWRCWSIHVWVSPGNQASPHYHVQNISLRSNFKELKNKSPGFVKWSIFTLSQVTKPRSNTRKLKTDETEAVELPSAAEESSRSSEWRRETGAELQTFNWGGLAIKPDFTALNRIQQHEVSSSERPRGSSLNTASQIIWELSQHDASQENKNKPHEQQTANLQETIQTLPNALTRR